MLGAAQGLVSPPAVALALVLVVIAAGFRLAHRGRVPAGLHDREDLSSMSWTEVKRVTGALFANQGYAVTGVRRNSLAGVDLVLHRGYERIFVRLDHWKVWTVGAEPLYRLYQLMRREGADHCVVLTAGEFSPEARNFAGATGLEIVDGRTLAALIDRTPGAALDLAA